MGRAANEKKDRTCSICEDVRLRTAREMRDHYAVCLARAIVKWRLETAGLVAP